ncbi:MAG: DUF5615 family PIN-like protein [Acidobacteriia bacterium]|nr:DUF5615 family PIN-like protein [Terriglobia bacterium]
MRLKLDENLSRHLKASLETLRHDVATALEEGLASKADSTIADAAKRERRMLPTLDVEFANLKKYPPGNHPGIVLFRPHSLSPLTVNRFVEEFVASIELGRLAGCIVVVEPSRVRVRCPEATPTPGEVP